LGQSHSTAVFNMYAMTKYRTQKTAALTIIERIMSRARLFSSIIRQSPFMPLSITLAVTLSIT